MEFQSKISPSINYFQKPYLSIFILTHITILRKHMPLSMHTQRGFWDEGMIKDLLQVCFFSLGKKKAVFLNRRG